MISVLGDCFVIVAVFWAVICVIYFVGKLFLLIVLLMLVGVIVKVGIICFNNF